MKRGLLASVALLLTGPALAETHFDNLRGMSIDRQGRVDRFSGMVVDEEGRVVQLLDFGDRPRGEIDFYEDLNGATVVPGFIDSHAHVMALGLSKLTLDLSETRSLDEALALVAAYAAANPNNPWLVGRGWNEVTWGLGRLPTAAELDTVSGGRPIVLERADGHAVWASSAALAAANITAQTPDPAGGRIVRVGGTGAGSRAPAGVLVDNAMALVTDRVPPPRASDRNVALWEAEEEFLRHGVTAVADMGTSVEDWMTFRRAGDAGALRLRIMAYADGVPAILLIGGTGPTSWLYNDRLRLNGVKLWLDGALGSRGALLKADYTDDRGNRGLPVLDGTQLRNSMVRAAMDGFQVAIHAIGDAANADALDAIDQLAMDFTGDRRWRIEHAQVVDPADVPLFARHGTIASMQPIHQSSDRLMAEARLGPDRLAGAYAWRSIMAAGAPLAFGSDAPVEVADPLAGIAAAISRTGSDGEPQGGWQPQEAISREAALAAYTAGGAYAGFAEGRFGTLAVGERADFVVLDGDPLTASAADLRTMRVRQTFIGGVRVWDNERPAQRPEGEAE
ncbi:amidohydrolase [Alteraurantiacibacter buctensis]|uniref:Amidohydrolase family protein n=1 Tax=Alteraurantiacibacter buctensis TaxID=1503981 RepID=A0A844Z0T1_9SPHN|nr:amidohydrolase [Alteraurantiacibacter buctensis]MXO72760.1 amidohydrolase family protein [Alteraurantiacibacter buctensis]